MSLFAKKEKKNNMRYNQLGSAGLRVSEICLGAMTFALDGTNPM
jgi:aryl-alcohol dehydrogenase-like predicted oxidoreductase